MHFTGFDWDHGNHVKCQQHGVSIAEIEALFLGQFHTAPDMRHSRDEERLKAMGKTNSGRDLLIAFTIRHKNGKAFVRPISARYMHRKEAMYYEKETTDSHD